MDRNAVVRRSVILGTPLVIGLLDLTHPTFTKEVGIYRGVLAHVDWWIALHLIQIPLFGLLGLAGCLLLDGVAGAAARVGRVALALFAVVYPAFDTLIGVATGILVKNGAKLPADQQATIAQALDVFWKSPVAFTVASTGSAAWRIGLLAVALALSRPRGRYSLIVFVTFIAVIVGFVGSPIGFGTPIWWVAILGTSAAFALVTQPSVPTGLFILSSFLLAADHAPPLGPLGMLCFFLAALSVTLFPQWLPEPVRRANEKPPSPRWKGAGG